MSDVKVMSTEGVLLLNMSQINKGDNIFICWCGSSPLCWSNFRSL